MKTKLILGTAALAMSATASFAAVELSGDGRMGVVYDGTDWAFTSRARVKFTLSGTADNGLEFGGSFRADNAGAAAGGTAGEVFIKGTFGKLAMGDVDHADKAAVGQIDGVGLTGLNDWNEIIYDSGDAKPNPSVLYTYEAGAFTGMLSVDMDETMAVGAKYSMGDYTVALGYTVDGVDSDTQISLSGSAVFGGATVKAIYSTYDGIGTLEDQYGLSATFKPGAGSGPISVTAYVLQENFSFGSDQYWGLGGSYDLGGGLSLVGGVAHNSTADVTVADFGVSMSF